MAEWTRNTSWRQGHVLTDEAIMALGLRHHEQPDETVVVVATHNCDLVQKPDKEPHVEVIIGRKITAPNGSNTNAKNARTLDIEFKGEQPWYAEFVITEKRSIPKNELVNFLPATSGRLAPSSLAIFQAWLAARYRRSAFPDEFVRRLQDPKLDKKIAKALEPSGEMITAVFFVLDDEKELSPEDVYVINILLLHASEPDFFEAAAAAEKAKAAIERDFKAKLYNPQAREWEGIELREVEVVSENGITYAAFKNLKQWRLDHISLGADPQQPVLSE